MQPGAKVLVLTLAKDAEPFLGIYFDTLYRLTYPRERLSFGFLESDSADNTYREIERRVRSLMQQFRAASLWKKDFGFHLPKGMPRWDRRIQLQRPIPRFLKRKSRGEVETEGLGLMAHDMGYECWELPRLEIRNPRL